MNKFLPMIAIVFLFSCSSNEMKSTKKVKNVILMIGDGMGPQQISLLYYFVKYSKLGVVDKDDERCLQMYDFVVQKIDEVQKKIRDLERIENMLINLKECCPDEKSLYECPIIETLMNEKKVGE